LTIEFEAEEGGGYLAVVDQVGWGNFWVFGFGVAASGE